MPEGSPSASKEGALAGARGLGRGGGFVEERRRVERRQLPAAAVRRGNAMAELCLARHGGGDSGIDSRWRSSGNRRCAVAKDILSGCRWGLFWGIRGSLIAVG
jgi:hypothetical protein